MVQQKFLCIAWNLHFERIVGFANHIWYLEETPPPQWVEPLPKLFSSAVWTIQFLQVSGALGSSNIKGVDWQDLGLNLEFNKGVLRRAMRPKGGSCNTKAYRSPHSQTGFPAKHSVGHRAYCTVTHLPVCPLLHSYTHTDPSASAAQNTDIHTVYEAEHFIVCFWLTQQDRLSVYCKPTQRSTNYRYPH